MSDREVPGTEENLITRICSIQDSMPEAERRVADYLMAHQSTVMALSQAELARAAGVSAPTISRFCRRVGERDFHAFQLSFAKAMYLMHNATPSEAPVPQVRPALGNLDESLAVMLQTKMTEISATMQAIQPDRLAEVVCAIAGARMVEVAGTGRTISVAESMSYMLERMGVLSSNSPYYEKLLTTAACLTPQDVLVVITRSGWAGMMQQVAQAAHDHGARIVVITANRRSPLAQIADWVFVETSFAEVVPGFTGDSRVAEELIVEVICTLVATELGDQATDYYEQHGNYVVSEVAMP